MVKSIVNAATIQKAASPKANSGLFHGKKVRAIFPDRSL
jgi:hypothetical protein